MTSRSVQLVGSIPLDTTQNVFESVAGTLGNLVARIPDGEVGERFNWIGWQRERFADVDALEVRDKRPIAGDTPRPLFGLKDGFSEDAIKFGPLGYAEAAKSSYALFTRLRSEGKIPSDVRFQVSLPTPLAAVYHFTMRSHIKTILPHYEEQMIAELQQIVQSIPAADLAIQWDICVEIVRFLEAPDTAEEFPASWLLNNVARVANAVPEGVELGFHFCYGDAGHKHTLEPKDTGLMVDTANALAKLIKRPWNWLHMPVPRDRDDTAYFAPLSGLKLPAETKLYLGLVHHTDGVEGAKRRLAAASTVMTDFGVATECGWGRRAPETIPALLDLHRDVALLN